MNLKKLFFAAVIVLSANASFAQVADSEVATHTVAINIEEVALLDLHFLASETNTSTSITLAGTAPTEAGEAMIFEDEFAKNASIWMNYSSIVSGDLRRNVTVAITDGAVPAGLKLTVLASAASGDGAGIKGTALLTAHKLTGIATEIVSGIGSTYTGDGASKGRNLTYQLSYATDAATDYAVLDFSDTNVLEITYTLTDI